VHCGPLGAGTTCKLINNSISIGMAAKAKVDLAALYDVLSAGAVDGRMWRMMEPWVRSGDDSSLKGSLRIAAKDLRAYGGSPKRGDRHSGRPKPPARRCGWRSNLGHGETFLLAVPSILAALNGAKIAPTSDGQRPVSASIE
jgi:hypothetical protein